MPAKRPRAAFDPISPTFDLSALVEKQENFTYVDRISCDMIDQQGMEAFDKLVLLHVIIGGKPLVIDGYHSRLDPWTFSSKWLQDNVGAKVEMARDITKTEPLPLTIGHYLRNMSTVTNPFFSSTDGYKKKDRQRIYLKDIDCPEVWFDKLKEQLPPNLFYFNDNTGEVGGPGSTDESIPTGGKRKGRGIGPAGDLMSSLPPPMRAVNMMCYIGHEGTYTPAHREMCGSLGHNIMVEASDVLGEDGKPERPGSSIWFMTETKDRHSVAEYWLSILGHDIEVENHFAQVSAWRKAPFTTYVVEQRPGDFILIPPLAPHQVWNRGTRTMKVAWNRTTAETLELAIKEALPNAKMVCRDEQYKNKAIIYYTLQKYSQLLARAKDFEQTVSSPQEAAAIRTSPKIKQLQKDFKKLFQLYKTIMLTEMFAPESHEKNIQFESFDSNITCAYCRCNIFNRFLTCTSCTDALGTTEPEPYDVCMECYAMGRSCGCISKLRWAEQFKWKELASKYEQWRRQYLDIERKPKADSPLPLAEERQKSTQKTLAQVCQEQLKRRPWVDIKKPLEDDENDENEEIEVNDDGTVKKTKKRRSEAWLKNRHACHVCQHRHEKWKMASCKCGRWWCYGSLFRAHDLMPQAVMEDPDWTCPHCQNICGAGSCRKDPKQSPYQPKGTLLGHDTRKVADARSIESLVDFSVSNLTWLKETATDAPVDNMRLLERQEEADRAKAAMAMMEDPLGSDAEDDARINYDQAEDTLLDPMLDDSVIDPMLGGTPSTSRPRLPAAHHEHPGYQPAMHDGFVAPSAVMFQAVNADAEEYPDLDDEGGRQRNKRKRNEDEDTIIRAQTKKRVRPEDRDLNVPVSGATKQYRKEQERKALEEARKKGNFIRVHARLKGRSKMVKLTLDHNVLARLQSRPQVAITESPVAAAAAAESPVEPQSLLRSDLAPPPQTARAAAAPKTAKSANKVLVRVEDDEDFAGTRGRSHHGPKKSSRKNKKNIEYEELDIASDVEGTNEEDDNDNENTATGTRSKRRRISAWQAQRQGEADDDEDIPAALPENYREGQRPSTKRHGRVTIGGKGPARQPPRAASVDTGSRLAQLAAAGLANDEDDENDLDEDEEIEEVPQVQDEDKEEEEEEEEEEGKNEEIDSVCGEAEPAEEEFVKSVATMSGSIMARAAGGRSIKIIGGKNKRKRQTIG